MSKLLDCRQTPQWLFDQLNEQYGPFDIDLCATKDNSKCGMYCKDYLTISRIKSWNLGNFKGIGMGGVYNNASGICPMLVKIEGKTCFMNPPYRNPRPFVEKAWGDAKYCRIVALVKVDPSTKWWSVFWGHNQECEYCTNGVIALYEGDDWCPVCNKLCDNKSGKYNGPKPGCQVFFLPKRVKFDPPQELINSGEVWKEGKNWAKMCSVCNGNDIEDPICYDCVKCNGKGHIKLSGPSFPSAVLVFDRRHL